MSKEKHCLLLILRAKRSLISLKKVYSASVARKIHSVDQWFWAGSFQIHWALIPCLLKYNPGSITFATKLIGSILISCIEMESLEDSRWIHKLVTGVSSGCGGLVLCSDRENRCLKRRKMRKERRKRVGGRRDSWLNNSCWDYCLIKAVICMHSFTPPYRADQKAMLCRAQ